MRSRGGRSGARTGQSCWDGAFQDTLPALSRGQVTSGHAPVGAGTSGTRWPGEISCSREPTATGGRRPRPAPSAQPRVRWRTLFRGWHLCAGGYVLPTSPCGTREVSGETASARQDEVVVPPPVRGGSATPRCHIAGRRGDRRRRTAPRTNRCPARRNRPGRRLTAPPPGPARSPSLGRSREATLRSAQPERHQLEGPDRQDDGAALHRHLFEVAFPGVRARPRCATAPPP